MNKLPKSWAILNDGSEEFQIVVDYLRSKGILVQYILIDFYYGITKEGDFCCTRLQKSIDTYFDTILTIKQFKDLIQ